MKKSNKKLSLSREAIRTLTANQMQRAAGGLPTLDPPSGGDHWSECASCFVTDCCR